MSAPAWPTNQWACIYCGTDCCHPAPLHDPDCPRGGGLEVADGTERCAGCRAPFVAGEAYAPRMVGVLASGATVTAPMCLGCAVTHRPTMEVIEP